MRQVLILAALVVTCGYCAAQEPVLRADPVIQERIQRISKVLRPRTVHSSNDAAFAEMQALKDSVADKGEIVEQLAVFAADPTAPEHQSLLAVLILHLLDLPPKIVIPALAPHLDAENRNLRGFVRDWFQHHEGDGTVERPLQPLNYSDYADYIRDRNGEVPAPFAEYIFQRSPSRALLAFNGPTRQNAIAGLQREKARMDAAREGRLCLRGSPHKVGNGGGSYFSPTTSSATPSG